MNESVTFFMGFQISLTTAKKLTLGAFIPVVVNEACGWLSNNNIKIPTRLLTPLEIVSVLCSFLNDGELKLRFQLVILFILYDRYNDLEAISTRLQAMQKKEELRMAVLAWKEKTDETNLDEKILRVWGVLKSIEPSKNVFD